MALPKRREASSSSFSELWACVFFDYLEAGRVLNITGIYSSISKHPENVSSVTNDIEIGFLAVL